MHGVVLFLHIVEVAGVLVDFVCADHALKQKEGVEVLMLPAGRVIEHSDRAVEHLIVTDHKQARVEHRLLRVEHRQGGRSWQRGEVLFHEVDQLVVPDGARSHDHHVLAEVVPLVEFHDHVARDLADVVDIAEDGLAHHVLAEDVEVDVLHEGLLRVLVYCFQLLPDGVLLQLDVVAVIRAVAEHVAHDLDGAGDAVRKAERVVHGVLAARVGVELRARVLDLHLELPSRSVLGAFEVQVLQKVRRTRAF